MEIFDFNNLNKVIVIEKYRVKILKNIGVLGNMYYKGDNIRPWQIL